MKRILFLALGLLMTTLTFAQTAKVVRWTVEAKPSNIEKTEYTLTAKAVMEDGYHIWAMDAGGDGSLIPTSITLTQEPAWKNEWTSDQKVHAERLEFIEGTVFSYSKTVTFSRQFTLPKGKHKLTGTVTFQSCNESMCLPPEDVPFEITLP